MLPNPNFNVEEHEQKINELNERYLAGTLSRNELETQIAELLGENNLAYKLRDRLLQQVNEKISAKLKDRLSEREYFMRRDELENQTIQSGFPFAFFRDDATIEEIAKLDLNVMNKKTMMLVLISALRAYVDGELENDPKCQALHILYLKLKKELSSIIPFEEGDGFAEYLASKDERNELQNARQTGNVCIVCGSREIHSKGKEWICENGHRFRKH